MHESPSGVFVRHAKIGQLDPAQLRSHSHTSHALTFLVQGWVRLDHGGTITAKAGSVNIVPAGVPHRPLEAHDVDCWMVGFCATCLQLDESQLLMSPFYRVRQGALPIVAIAKTRQRRLVRLYRELREEGERGAPESPELVRSLLLLLLGEVRRATESAQPGSPQGSLVSDALEFIQRRCLDSISLKDVAAAVHRSPAHVTSMIKRETGYSVGKWINSGRIAEAANRLVHTDDSLDEIAGHVGWQDTTHLIRQFRKAYGATPAAWRRAQREKHGRAP